LHKICLEDIPLLSQVDPALAPFDAVLARGLERDRDLRFQTAEEFAEAIEEQASTLEGVASPRTVAKLVREYASEKLERDQHLIRAAMSEISAAGGGEHPAPVAMTAPAQPSRAKPQQPAPLVVPPPAVATVVDEAQLDEPAPRTRRWGPLIIGALTLVALAAAAAAFWLQREEAPVRSAPLAAPATPAVPDAPALPDAPAGPDAPGAQDGPTATGNMKLPGADEAAAPPEEPTSPQTGGPASPPRKAAQADNADTPSKPPKAADGPTDTREPVDAKTEPVVKEKEPRRPRRQKQVSTDDLLLNPYRTTN
jgi:hypothetical protein